MESNPRTQTTIWRPAWGHHICRDLEVGWIGSLFSKSFLFYFELFEFGGFYSFWSRIPNLKKYLILKALREKSAPSSNIPQSAVAQQRWASSENVHIWELPSWWTQRPPDTEFSLSRSRTMTETMDTEGQTPYASHIFYGQWPSHKERVSRNYFSPHKSYDSPLRPLEELEQFTEAQSEDSCDHMEATRRKGSGTSLLETGELVTLVCPQDLFWGW